MKSRKNLLVAALLVVVLIAGLFALKVPLLHWRLRRLTVTAESLMKQGDQHGAVLTARTILASDPRNIAACAIMARSAQEDRSPLALYWRQRLVDLQPGNAAPLLDLARSAVGLGESATAETALNQVPAGDRNTAAFHDVAAAWALSLKQYELAAKHAEAALQFEPRNLRLQLNLAALKLVVADATASAAARADMEAIRKNPEFREEATRDLLADARRRGDAAAASGLARDLDAAPDATVADHLLYLEELQRAHSGELEPRLAALQGGATAPGTIYTIMEWMTVHGMAAQSVQWHVALPAASRKMPELLSAAEACVAQGAWDTLRDLIRGQQWDDLEFLRLAFETRLHDEQSKHERGSDFKNLWERTMFSTGGNANAMAMLARLARSWGWKEQAAEAWWSVANRRTGQRPALAELFEMATQEKDTRELYRVSRRILEVEPGSLVAKNNVAMFALLRREDLPEAHKLAAEDFAVAPAEPAIVSTYAFSLYLQGHTQDAVGLMAKLPAAVFEDPSMAACNGVLLSAAGEVEKARPFLDLALREKARLFPEEIALAEQALRQP